jgi:hypothetical protein
MHRGRGNLFDDIDLALQVDKIFSAGGNATMPSGDRSRWTRDVAMMWPPMRRL